MSDAVKKALKSELKKAAIMHTRADMANPKRKGEMKMAKIKFRNAERMLRERREKAQTTDSNQ